MNDKCRFCTFYDNPWKCQKIKKLTDVYVINFHVELADVEMAWNLDEDGPLGTRHK